MSINGNTIYVLPCLQELKTSGTLLGNEKEQQIDKKNDTSNLFDAYWSGNNVTPDSNMTKNGLLTIPDCSTFGFNLKNIDYLNSRNYKNITTPLTTRFNSGKIPECGDFSCSQKWSIYTNFLKDKCIDGKNVALLVTHHNRMRDSTQGLIPFKKYFFKKNPYNAYANNFCLKISIKDGIPIYSLFFKGFPDKGEFENCYDENEQKDAYEIESDNDTNNDYVLRGYTGGKNRGGFFKKKYKYFCNEDIGTFIDIELITKVITDANINNNLDIYVIRHGNSLHNKPVEVSSQNDRLDSSLTPLGMYQAKELGNYFISVLNNANIILCCSFLQRTQLTGLLLLYYAGLGSVMSKEMINGMIYMLDEAIIRYSKAQNGFDPTKFLGYSPLGKIIKYNNGDKNYEAFEGENTKFIDYLSELKRLLSLLIKNNDSTDAIDTLINILKDKLMKSIVEITPEGWSRIKNDNDDDYYYDNDDDPRFPNRLINKGGKKRRQTKKQRVMKSKKVRRVKKSNKKSKKVKRRSNKRKA